MKKERNSHLHDYEKSVEHPKSFSVYNTAGTVIALCSLSKILTQALRFGFVCASHEHVNAMRRYSLIHSGGSASPFISGILIVN